MRKIAFYLCFLLLLPKLSLSQTWSCEEHYKNPKTIKLFEENVPSRIARTTLSTMGLGIAISGAIFLTGPASPVLAAILGGGAIALASGEFLWNSKELIKPLAQQEQNACTHKLIQSTRDFLKTGRISDQNYFSKFYNKNFAIETKVIDRNKARVNWFFPFGKLPEKSIFTPGRYSREQIASIIMELNYKSTGICQVQSLLNMPDINIFRYYSEKEIAANILAGQ